MTEKQRQIVAKYPMVKLYIKHIEANRMSVEQVPVLWREHVIDYLT